MRLLAFALAPLGAVQQESIRSGRGHVCQLGFAGASGKADREERAPDV